MDFPHKLTNNLKEKIMMNQFEIVVADGGIRYLTIVDTSRYDFFWGFYRIIKVLD